jgi:SulP family sulfate permease
VLLLAARLKLGVIADLLSRPVLIGYLNGASLVLIATQLGKMFGIKTEGEEFFELVFTVFEKLPRRRCRPSSSACCWLGCWSDWRAGCRAYRERWRSVRWRLPRPSLFDLGSYGIALVGEFPRGAAV